MPNENKLVNEDKKSIKKLDALREKGDWETELSEVAPLKNRDEQRVSVLKKLPNGLTPYEMMYGKQDNDYDILAKSLE